jgi:hypothetical protein
MAVRLRTIKGIGDEAESNGIGCWKMAHAY